MLTPFDDNLQLLKHQEPAAQISPEGSKKPLFFMGNWTFRERNKSSRPSISEALRDDRPHSMNLTDIRTPTTRSKSGEVIGPRQEFPRNVETRTPVRIERSSMVRRRPSNLHSPSSSSSAASESQTGEFKTMITVDDSGAIASGQIAVMRAKKEETGQANNNNNNNNNNSGNSNNNRYSFQSCVQLRKSCPDLDSSVITNMEHHRVSKKQRTRRAKEKISQAAWKKKPVKDWTLDDVLLWLQSAQMDEVASLLIGYELRGEDLLQWNDHTLAQLGVSSRETREQLLTDLTKIIETGPEPVEEQGKVSSSNHRTLFDIVKQTSYDQVLAVETPLTTRDITVTHGRLGCLQITKVNGANLPLKEHDWTKSRPPR
uniref:SAM domain-containing protein n=1 Tax=Caenorhabditis japonica TaxID=281687 RepID=A0A8R1DH45_CAEJA